MASNGPQARHYKPIPLRAVAHVPFNSTAHAPLSQAILAICQRILSLWKARQEPILLVIDCDGWAYCVPDSHPHSATESSAKHAAVLSCAPSRVVIGRYAPRNKMHATLHHWVHDDVVEHLETNPR